ncbi:MAG: type II toxin-antitoxin system RelE/ParE family toxin [Owenweeksia sp.]
MGKKVIWTKRSQSSLRKIWEFYAEKNIAAADRIIDEILSTAESIKFEEQYQAEETSNGKYRRAVVRHFKIIYLVKGKTLEVLRVFDARQDPGKLKK